MKIAILGTGPVGRTLAGRLTELGHDVTLGTRNPEATRGRQEYAAWSTGPARVALATFPDASAGADLGRRHADGLRSRGRDRPRRHHDRTGPEMYLPL